MFNLDTQAFLLLFHAASVVPRAWIVWCAEYLPIVLVVTGVAYVFYAPAHRKRAYEFLAAAFVAVVLSRAMLTELIRLLFPRDRPALALDLVPLFPEHAASFPSGHAATLFAIAGILSMRDRRAGIVFASFAVLICLARVAAGVHYPLDILGGAIVGMGSAYVVQRYLFSTGR